MMRSMTDALYGRSSRLRSATTALLLSQVVSAIYLRGAGRGVDEDSETYDERQNEESLNIVKDDFDIVNTNLPGNVILPEHRPASSSGISDANFYADGGITGHTSTRFHKDGVHGKHAGHRKREDNGLGGSFVEHKNEPDDGETTTTQERSRESNLSTSQEHTVTSVRENLPGTGKFTEQPLQSHQNAEAQSEEDRQGGCSFVEGGEGSCGSDDTTRKASYPIRRKGRAEASSRDADGSKGNGKKDDAAKSSCGSACDGGHDSPPPDTSGTDKAARPQESSPKEKKKNRTRKKRKRPSKRKSRRRKAKKKKKRREKTQILRKGAVLAPPHQDSERLIERHYHHFYDVQHQPHASDEVQRQAEEEEKKERKDLEDQGVDEPQINAIIKYRVEEGKENEKNNEKYLEVVDDDGYIVDEAGDEILDETGEFVKGTKVKREDIDEEEDDDEEGNLRDHEKGEGENEQHAKEEHPVKDKNYEEVVTRVEFEVAGVLVGILPMVPGEGFFKPWTRPSAKSDKQTKKAANKRSTLETIMYDWLTTKSESPSEWCLCFTCFYLLILMCGKIGLFGSRYRGRLEKIYGPAVVMMKWGLLTFSIYGSVYYVFQEIDNKKYKNFKDEAEAKLRTNGRFGASSHASFLQDDSFLQSSTSVDIDGILDEILKMRDETLQPMIDACKANMEADIVGYFDSYLAMEYEEAEKLIEGGTDDITNPDPFSPAEAYSTSPKFKDYFNRALQRREDNLRGSIKHEAKRKTKDAAEKGVLIKALIEDTYNTYLHCQFVNGEDRGPFTNYLNYMTRLLADVQLTLSYPLLKLMDVTSSFINLGLGFRHWRDNILSIQARRGKYLGNDVRGEDHGNDEYVLEYILKTLHDQSRTVVDSEDEDTGIGSDSSSSISSDTSHSSQKSAKKEPLHKFNDREQKAHEDYKKRLLSLRALVERTPALHRVFMALVKNNAVEDTSFDTNISVREDKHASILYTDEMGKDKTEGGGGEPNQTLSLLFPDLTDIKIHQPVEEGGGEDRANEPPELTIGDLGRKVKKLEVTLYFGTQPVKSVFLYDDGDRRFKFSPTEQVSSASLLQRGSRQAYESHEFGERPGSLRPRSFTNTHLYASDRSNYHAVHHTTTTDKTAFMEVGHGVTSAKVREVTKAWKKIEEGIKKSTVDRSNVERSEAQSKLAKKDPIIFENQHDGMAFLFPPTTAEFISAIPDLANAVGVRALMEEIKHEQHTQNSNDHGSKYRTVTVGLRALSKNVLKQPKKEHAFDEKVEQMQNMLKTATLEIDIPNDSIWLPKEVKGRMLHSPGKTDSTDFTFSYKKAINQDGKPQQGEIQVQRNDKVGKIFELFRNDIQTAKEIKADTSSVKHTRASEDESDESLSSATRHDTKGSENSLRWNDSNSSSEDGSDDEEPSEVSGGDGYKNKEVEIAEEDQLAALDGPMVSFYDVRGASKSAKSKLLGGVLMQIALGVPYIAIHSASTASTWVKELAEIRNSETFSSHGEFCKNEEFKELLDSSNYGEFCNDYEKKNLENSSNYDRLKKNIEYYKIGGLKSKDALYLYNAKRLKPKTESQSDKSLKDFLSDKWPETDISKAEDVLDPSEEGYGRFLFEFKTKDDAVNPKPSVLFIHTVATTSGKDELVAKIPDSIRNLAMVLVLGEDVGTMEDVVLKRKETERLAPLSDVVHTHDQEKTELDHNIRVWPKESCEVFPIDNDEKDNDFRALQVAVRRLDLKILSYDVSKWNNNNEKEEGIDQIIEQIAAGVHYIAIAGDKDETIIHLLRDAREICEGEQEWKKVREKLEKPASEKATVGKAIFKNPSGWKSFVRNIRDFKEVDKEGLGGTETPVFIVYNSKYLEHESSIRYSVKGSKADDTSKYSGTIFKLGMTGPFISTSDSMTDPFISTSDSQKRRVLIINSVSLPAAQRPGGEVELDPGEPDNGELHGGLVIGAVDPAGSDSTIKLKIPTPSGDAPKELGQTKKYIDESPNSIGGEGILVTWNAPKDDADEPHVTFKQDSIGIQTTIRIHELIHEDKQDKDTRDKDSPEYDPHDDSSSLSDQDEPGIY